MIFRVYQGTYNTAELVLTWDQPHAVEISEQLHLTEFELVNKRTYAKESEAGLRDGAFGKFCYRNI